MADRIVGTTGDDIFEGTSGDDQFQTLEGNDTVNGGAGDDIIVTNEGDDILLGGDGNDQLFGCEDNDILDGGAGQDLLNGGTGNDLLIFRASENATNASPDFYDGHTGTDTLRLILTAAEFQAAQADIQAFQAYIEQYRVSEEETDGPFFHFSTLNLAARRIENFQVVVDDEFVIGEEAVLVDDEFSEVIANEAFNSSVSDNDTIPEGSVYEIVEDVEKGTLVMEPDGSYTFEPGDDFISLGEGETETVTFVYQVTTPLGTVLQSTGSITVTGVNDAPTASELEVTSSEDEDSFIVDLLVNVEDPDANDVLTISNVRIDDGLGGSEEFPPATGSQANASVTDNQIIIDLSRYQFLAPDETATIVVEYDISDGLVTITNRATLTITGSNDGPVVTEPVTETISEDDFEGEVDLLSGTFDPEGDELSILNLELAEGDDSGISIDGTIIRVNGDAYTSLALGETTTITYTYQIQEANGLISDQTATITIQGENDGPEAGEDAEITVAEADEIFSLDVLDGASDIDGDALSFDEVRVISGNADAVLISTENIEIDPNVFKNILFDDEVATIVIEVDIVDGNGGVATRTFTINVEGETAIVLPEDDIISVDADETTTGRVGLNDNVPDDAVFSVETDVERGTLVFNADGSFTYDPGPEFEGLLINEQETETFTYRVTAPDGTTSTATATITIVGQNFIPSGPTASQSFSEDLAGIVNIELLDLVFDDGPDPLSVLSVRFLDMNGDVFEPGSEISVEGSTVSVDPSVFQYLNEGERFDFTIEYVVSDGAAQGTVTTPISILGVEDSPTAGAPIVFRMSESDGSVLLNDLILNAVTDADLGDDALLRIVSIGGDNLTTAPEGADLTNGLFTFDPISYGADLDDGETRTVTVVVEVDDDLADPNGTALQTIQIVIEGVTQDPPGVFDSVPDITFPQGSLEGSGTVRSSSIFDTITDPNGDSITFVGFLGDSEGITYDEVTGEFILDLNDGAFEGLREGEIVNVDYFFQVTDGLGGFTDHVVTGTVIGTNDAPILPADAIEVFVTEDTTIETIPLLNGVFDPDILDRFFVTNIRGIEGFEDAFKFDPIFTTFIGDLPLDTNAISLNFLSEGEELVFNLTFDIVDFYGGVTEQTATITVTGVNDLPEQTAGLAIAVQALLDSQVGSLDTNENSVRVVDLLSTTFDFESDILTIVDFEIDAPDPSLYTDAISIDFATGIMTVDFSTISVPAYENVSIRYTVEDEDGGQSEFFVDVGLVGVQDNQSPVSSGLLTLNFTEDDIPNTVSLLDNLSDDDGNPLVIERVIGFDESFFDLDAGEISISGLYDFLAADDNLSLSFTLEIGDGNGGSTEQDVQINIAGANDAPIASFTSANSIFDDDFGIVTLDILFGVTDADGDDLSITYTTSGGELTVFGDLIDGRHFAVDTSAHANLQVGESVQQLFEFTITDGNGGNLVVTRDITIQGTNDLPEIINQDVRFFDNDVANYQTSGQQNFVINSWEVFSDFEGAEDGDRFTSVSVADGSPTIGVSIGANGEILIDSTGLADRLDSGERLDFVFNWEGITEDGDVISGQLDYRVEGTSAGDANVNASNPKGHIQTYEPGRTDDETDGFASRTLDDDFETGASGEDVSEDVTVTEDVTTEFGLSKSDAIDWSSLIAEEVFSLL